MEAAESDFSTVHGGLGRDPTRGSGNSLFAAALRDPPANLEAEQAVLGALLANNRAFERVGTFLRAEHFADPVHARIYAAIAERVAEGRVADAVTLRSHFEGSGALDDAGGVAYLAGLLSAMVGIVNAAEYARVIVDTFLRREMIARCEAAVAAAFNGDPEAPSAEEQMETLKTSLSALDEHREQPGTMRTLAAAATAAMRRAEAVAAAGGVCGTSTGYYALDRRTGGLEDGTAHFLAGRPGMGKTGLANGIAVKVARGEVAEDYGTWRQGEPGGVLVISLEMSAEQSARRMHAMLAGVPYSALKRGTWQTSDDEAYRVIRAQKEMHSLPLLIEDQPSLRMEAIELRAMAAARHFRQRGTALRLIVLDHLHLVGKDPRSRSGDTQQVGEIAKGVKRLAKRMECPVLALAQLSRGVEGREDKRPTLSDLRQSGEIEEIADSVSFIYRPEYYMRTPPERRPGVDDCKYDDLLQCWEEDRARVAGKAEVIYAKLRDEDPGTELLHFDGPLIRFSDASPEMIARWR
jgi:replicative DNA helicase